MSSYDKTYYEDGFAKGVSCYTNYRWMPEFTLPLAHRIIRRLDIQPTQRVLDYGCAKGYLVHALRLLDIDAYGCDVSRYALSEAPSAVRPYLAMSTGPKIPFGHKQWSDSWSWVIAKDVLEHLTEGDLIAFLKDCRMKSDRLFVVVPLGNGEQYHIPQYEMDTTHILRQPLTWWVDTIKAHGWRVEEATTDVTGIKDSWAHYDNGNGILRCK